MGTVGIILVNTLLLFNLGFELLVLKLEYSGWNILLNEASIVNDYIDMLYLVWYNYARTMRIL